MVVDFSLQRPVPESQVQVQARFSQVSSATALGRGPAGAPAGRGASQVWGPDQWRVEICLEPAVCFPPRLLSLENVLFCEISKSAIYSAPGLWVGREGDGKPKLRLT